MRSSGVIPASGASLEVFRPLQRSLAAPRAIPRRAAGPANHPASALSRDTRAVLSDGPVSPKLALAGSRCLERMRRGGARCGGRAGVGVGRIGTNDQGLSSGHRSGRRPVARSRRRADRAARGRPVNPETVTLAADPTTRKRRRLASAAHVGSCTDAPFRAVFRYPGSWACNARPGRSSWSFPRLVRRRSWGSVRSALRRFDPTDRWCARFRATGPACRSCRLVRPIVFRRVAGCSQVSDPREARRPGMRWRRLPGFAPIRGPPPPRVGDGDDPALGFASCRVGGQMSLHPGGHVPARITSLRG